MSKYTMNNQTEFMFDETLTVGFTTVYNEILMDTRLSDSAIGLYCRIIRFRNIPNWVINQKTLEHENNKRTKVESAMKELISAGYIDKIQLRNSKGHMDGVKYIVYSKSKTFGSVKKEAIQPDAEKLNTDETLENKDFKPNAEKPKTDKPKSVNLQLENKDNNNNNSSSSSSSKGNAINSINPLVELFNGSICDLKKTTTTKFMKYVEAYDKEFIVAIISYCEEKNAKSFSYFETTIETYIANGITSVADMELAIEQFKDDNRKKKNNAIKEKEIAREENKVNSYLHDKAIDDMANSVNIEIDTKNAENIDRIKEDIKNIMFSSDLEIQYNTWIESTTLMKLDKDIIVECPNEFTLQIVSDRYERVIVQGLELSKIEYGRIKYSIQTV